MSDPFQNAFLNDQFWCSVAPHMFNANRWDRAATEVADVVRLTGPSTALPVLDVGCGPGRHAKAFAALGYRVVGIDVVKPYISAAAEACRAYGDAAQFIWCDAQEFASAPRFGLAISLFNSLGYRDQVSDARTLRNIRAALRPASSLAISLMTWEIASRRFRAESEQSYKGGTLRRKSKLVPESRHLIQEWEFVEDTRTRHFVSRQYLYCAEELRAVVTDAGFAGVELFGDFAGDCYNIDSDMLLLIGGAGRGSEC